MDEVALAGGQVEGDGAGRVLVLRRDRGGQVGVERRQRPRLRRDRDERDVPEVEVTDRVEDEDEDEVGGRLGDGGEEGEVDVGGGDGVLRVVGEADGELGDRPGLFVGAVPGGEGRDLAEHERPGLQDVLQDGRVDAPAAQEQVGEDIQTSAAAPVAHAGRVTVAHLDEPHLLQALERLAQGAECDIQLGGQFALARELLARRVPARQQGFQQGREDLFGDERRRPARPRVRKSHGRDRNRVRNSCRGLCSRP